MKSREDLLRELNSVEQQKQELQREIRQQAAEIEGIKDFLQYDPVAKYRGHVGARTLSLMGLLEDGWPETVTVKQAEMLTMGGPVPPAVINKQGRVPWEYVMDELADHFHMSEQQLINHIKSVSYTHLTLPTICSV